MPKIVRLVKLAPGGVRAIRAVDPSVELIEAGGWFEGEYTKSWPAETIARYVRGSGRGTSSERDAILAPAEVILGGFLILKVPKVFRWQNVYLVWMMWHLFLLMNLPLQLLGKIKIYMIGSL